MIRVAVIADFPLRAQRIASLIDQDERIEVVSAHPDKRDLVDVVVAVNLPGDQVPPNGVPVVVLSDESPEEFPFRGNVKAWLPLTIPAPELNAVIVAASYELVVLTHRQATASPRVRNPLEEDGDLYTEKLTARESQVLRMLADGLGNKEIAAQLKISDHTAKFHVAQILAKLDASSRAEAVAIGMRRGLVPI